MIRVLRTVGSKRDDKGIWDEVSGFLELWEEEREPAPGLEPGIRHFNVSSV